MQYKQISRILAEIIRPETPIKIVLATSKFWVKNEVLPKLGPTRNAAPANYCGAWRVILLGVQKKDGMQWRSSYRLG